MSRVVTFDEFGGPEVLRVTDAAIADPGAGEVRIKVEAIGVNRLDLMVRAGDAPRPIALPGARLGIEATGIIDAVGPSVTGVKTGDPVLITAVPDMDSNGTYADSIVVPAERVVARPAELDAAAAAAFWVPYSTAYGALIETGGMRPADRVLITAASSGVGLAAIQIARQIGAVPIAVTRSAAKTEALRAAGAAAVIVEGEQTLGDRVSELTGGAGVDIIIDSVMGPGLSDRAATARPGGTLLAVGWLDPRPAPFPRAAPLTIHRYMGFAHTLDAVVVRRIAAFLTAGVSSGVLSPVVDAAFDLDRVADAHRHVEEGGHIGRTVLTT